MMAFVIVGAIFSVLAFLLAAHAVIEVKAMQKSTHKVTFYNPDSQEFTKLNAEQKLGMTKDPFDNI